MRSTTIFLRSALPHLVVLAFFSCAGAMAGAAESTAPFPRPLSDYPEPFHGSVLQVLRERAAIEPFNVVATAIFFLAIVHTFLAPKIMALAHRVEASHEQALIRRGTHPIRPGERTEVSFAAQTLHFLGEVEAIFGIWVVPLLIALTLTKGWPVARDYVGNGLDFVEPVFVVVIMTMAATRPILKTAEQLLSIVADWGKGSPVSWWLTILTFGPLLGSLITEPAAMTISALLLSQKFYHCKPSPKLAYATLGLLFVNVSVGGTLTHFAAPPVLMVAPKWGWGLTHMLTHFGWKAVVAILAANVLYFGMFSRELCALKFRMSDQDDPALAVDSSVALPAWVTAIHILFLVWTVLTSHYPALFIGGFFFFLAFLQATEHHQDDLALRPALLVGFFLSGLVVHGGLQGWWIGPVLRRLAETPLFIGAGILTAFNDNAAITYLASLVPNLADSAKYSVVAGAVVGGGLTVIANAPNPAGQAILGRFFPNGVGPLGLLLGALLPTLLMGVLFLIL
jgi:hypothetical protein